MEAMGDAAMPRLLRASLYGFNGGGQTFVVAGGAAG
jgi:hypothetical protein